ncbi:MAG: PAS domain S-box protein [Chloroflexaceae bacterium]|nr:PAS domain S-box protein [Chloroflexaceae bacterium]
MERELNLYKQIVDNTSDAIGIVGVDGVTLYHNPAMNALLGYTPAEIDARGGPPAIYHDPAQAEQLFTTLRQGESWQGAVALKSRVGTLVSAFVRASVVRQDGEPVAFCGIYTDITEEQRAEEALRQNRILLQNILDNIPGIIFAIDRKDRHVFVNQQVANLLNLQREDIIGKTAYELFPPDVADRWQASHLRIREVKHAVQTDDTIETPNGTRYQRALLFPIFDAPDQDEPAFIGGIIFDVTEQKQTEQALQQSRILLQDIIENAPLSIFVKDLTGRYIIANQRTAETLQLRPEQMLNHTDFEILPAETAQEFVQVDRQIIDSGHAMVFEEVIPNSNGQSISRTHKFPIYNTEGELYAIGGISVDITEQRQRERELQIFKALVENAPDGIVTANLEGAFIYANPAILNRSGYGDARVGKDTTEVTTEHDKLLAALETVRNGGTWRGEVRNHRADGSIFIGEATGFPIYDDAGQVIALGSIIRDVTEQIQRERDLQEFKTMVEKAPNGIGLASTDGVFTYTNSAYGVITGYGDELPGINVFDIYESGEVEIGTFAEQVMLQGTAQALLMMRRKDGTRIPVQLSVYVITDAENEILGTVGIVRDMSERIARERELRRNQELLNIILGNAPIVFYIYDSKGTFILSEGKGLERLGLQPGQVVGLNLFELYKDNPYTASLHRQPLAGEVVNGSTIMGSGFFETWLIPIKDEQGEIVEVIGVALDVTERQYAEQEQARLRDELIIAQQVAIRELSTPLLPIANGVVIMPLVGSIDTGRAVQMMEALLEGVAQHRAHTAIIDITGVQVVDTQVANGFIQAAQAVQLLGARVIITGIQPQIAHALVTLGVELRGIVTRASLLDGVSFALRK